MKAVEILRCINSSRITTSSATGIVLYGRPKRIESAATRFRDRGVGSEIPLSRVDTISGARRNLFLPTQFTHYLNILLSHIIYSPLFASSSTWQGFLLF